MHCGHRQVTEREELSMPPLKLSAHSWQAQEHLSALLWRIANEGQAAGVVSSPASTWLAGPPQAGNKPSSR